MKRPEVAVITREEVDGEMTQSFQVKLACGFMNITPVLIIETELLARSLRF
jgi:hypothetical protein